MRRSIAVRERSYWPVYALREDIHGKHQPSRGDWDDRSVICDVWNWKRLIRKKRGRILVEGNFYDCHLHHSLPDRSISARRVQEVCRKLGARYSSLRRLPYWIFFA